MYLFLVLGSQEAGKGVHVLGNGQYWARETEDQGAGSRVKVGASVLLFIMVLGRAQGRGAGQVMYKMFVFLGWSGRGLVLFILVLGYWGITVTRRSWY